ncbi:MAG: hypothetical protein R2719_14335 [Micropruina sp.]
MLGVAGVTTMAGVFALALVATPRVAAMARVIRALVVVRVSGGAVVFRVRVLGRVMTVLGRRVVIVIIVLVVSGCLGALHHRLSSIPLGGI